MLRDTYNITVVAAVVAMTFASPLRGDNVQWFNTAMEDDWWDAVGDVTTIDFTGFPKGTFVTDQYADLGVNFGGNTIIIESSSFINDGWGIRGNGGTWVHFDQPMNWIAADHPGVLAFALFDGGDMIYESFALGGGGDGHFSGLISDKLFDTVYLFRPEPFDNIVFIDDLHFGALAVPAPGAVGALGLALLANRRRRRD